MMTWSSLWHPIWYEGHEHPSYLWQSGQSDNLTIDKLSLYPMLVGSIKAALLAMFVAVPVAFLAAVYTAFFASEYLRGKLKAAIEILESIPTVIIGFIVSMILVKVQGTGLLFLVIYLVSLPVAVFLHGLLQTRLKGDLNRQGIKGNAVWSLLLTFLLLAVLVYWIADKIPLDGYLIEANRVNYSDKIHSAVIIAFALGIAVVPSVYSLAEEAIYSVPRDLKQAAYSLGATSLQTLKKVVLVMAFPGILSAIVLGFGRAIGETMIVLMLTSNTPVADWSFFSELRTLTANLAIELPRSYVGSVHASVLFTSALLLFAFTFLINSIAQWLKFRLRKKYHYV
jgi:phosphate transport system permease protein